MKFGDTLYKRSVPQWAAYNVNYNELKRLIKERTSSGTAVPVTIPTAGISRWHDLENELFKVLSAEHDNVALFLRSKQGEIERRLSHLEKQVSSAKRAVDSGALDRPILQARKYQKLVKDAESIGDEVEKLSRFASVQKTAFRKILKKYRKWTGSTALQQRLEVEVFSSGALQVDYAHYLQRQSAQSYIITTELAGPMLSGSRFQSPNRDKPSRDGKNNQSNAKLIAQSCDEGPLRFDIALSTVPYGEAGGSAYFWIHPDNLEEAETLVLRHMRLLEDHTPVPSMVNGKAPDDRQNHLALYDNAQRFAQDTSLHMSSNMALAARWSSEPEAFVTCSSLVPKSTNTETVELRRKELTSALQRLPHSPRAKAQTKIRNYLAEHRDVKPLAECHSARSRYVGVNNTGEIGSWATLDSSIIFAPVKVEKLGDLHAEPDTVEAFPHAVLHVRWEFSRMPEIVRTLQSSHLAEAANDFSIEKAAVFTICKDLPQPAWRQLIGKDIRKVPSSMRKKDATRSKMAALSTVEVSSGPSSTDGPSDSVFSAGPGQSSATSMDNSPIMSQREQSSSQEALAAMSHDAKPSKKKRARIATPPSPDPPPQRYWNEFDDGDSDTHIEEGYAIYVDPNEPSFPGAEIVSRVFGSMYDSLSKGSQKIVSWLPIKSKHGQPSSGERTPLLFDGQGSMDADGDSSGSDTDELRLPIPKKPRQRSFAHAPSHLPWNIGGKYRPGQPLTKRQRALESTLFQFYTGLIALAYLLLIMAGILFSAGRKKKVLEVDAGIVAGVVAAEACAGISIVLICMRRKPLGPVHWGLVAVNVTSVAVIGIAELVVVFMGRA